MSKRKIQLSPELQAKVLAVGSSVTPQDVDTFDRLQEISDRSAKLRTILEAWERQHREERKLRQTYARWLLGGLGVQGLLVNVAFFMIGFAAISVDPWVANSFILAVFGEIAGMVFFIVKYLFPKVSADVLATLEKL